MQAFCVRRRELMSLKCVCPLFCGTYSLTQVSMGLRVETEVAARPTTCHGKLCG